MSVALLLFVLVLNRRTVWLAIVVGVAVLGLRDRRLGRRAIILVTLGAVVTAIAMVYLGGLQEGTQPVIKSGTGKSRLAYPGLVGAGRGLVTRCHELGRGPAIWQRLCSQDRRNRVEHTPT
jgi:hypothetical protein